MLFGKMRVKSGWISSGADKRFNGLDDDGNGYADDWRGWNMISVNDDPDRTTMDTVPNWLASSARR